MKLGVFGAGLIACAIGLSSAQARGPYGTIRIGNWAGGAYTNDDTGAFTACIAMANNALLLTANRRDFEKVQGLRFENWLE